MISQDLCKKTFDDASLIRLYDQQLNKKLSINIIKNLKTIYGQSFMCFNLKYKIKFYANAQIKGYLNKMLDNLEKDGEYYVKSYKLEDILIFQIKEITEDNKINVNFIKKDQEKYIKRVLPLSDDDEKQQEQDQKISNVRPTKEQQQVRFKKNQINFIE